MHVTHRRPGHVRARRGDSGDRHVRHCSARRAAEPPAGGEQWGSVESGRGTLIGAPSQLCLQRPGFRKDPGLLLLRWSKTSTAGARSLAIGGSSGDSGDLLFNNLTRTNDSRLVSAPLRVCPCTPLPCEMVLAERDVRGPGGPRAARHRIPSRMLAQRAHPKWSFGPSPERRASGLFGYLLSDQKEI